MTSEVMPLPSAERQKKKKRKMTEVQPKQTVRGQGGRRPNLKLSEFDTRAHYNVEPQLSIKTVGAIMGEPKN